MAQFRVGLNSELAGTSSLLARAPFKSPPDRLLKRSLQIVTTSTMGDLSARLVGGRWCGRLGAVLCLCLCATFCKPDDDVPMDPVPNLPARSLQCFEDGQVYGCCEGALRLNPFGIIAVPVGAVDYYCGGACVAETEDVLNCVASAMDGFTFYNGATVEDVRYALRRGCSHTARRGDFNDLEPRDGEYPDIYGDDDDGSDGNTVTAPLKLLALLGGAWLLLLGRWR
ncbi:hypothetical protein ACP70R_017324 [Stipagrostis hirtigluma subsp. patula]